MAPPPTTTEGTLRILRIIHGALIASILGYGLVLREIPAPSPRPADTVLLAGLGTMSLVAIAIALTVRSKMITPAFETLRLKPDDVESLNKWRRGFIVGAAFIESVVLYGVVIYLIGGTSRQAAPFIVAGTVVMLLWWPKRP